MNCNQGLWAEVERRYRQIYTMHLRQLIRFFLTKELKQNQCACSTAAAQISHRYHMAVIASRYHTILFLEQLEYVASFSRGSFYFFSPSPDAFDEHAHIWPQLAFTLPVLVSLGCPGASVSGDTRLTRSFPLLAPLAIESVFAFVGARGEDPTAPV